jgi:hypothetical protein
MFSGKLPNPETAWWSWEDSNRQPVDYEWALSGALHPKMIRFGKNSQEDDRGKDWPS